MQTSLIKLQNLLGMAELYMHNFKRFTQQIELAHNELAVLLDLLEPFKEEQFNHIQHETLKKIPEDLKPFLQAGLGKTAVNLFAGINAALMKGTPDPVRVFSPDFYYEQVNFLGQSHPFHKIINNPDINKIDLYACQFNPNVSVEKNKFDYTARDIVSDIRQILEKKGATEHLTVALDSTIDYINSEKNYQLFKAFEKEIKEGRLNFIVFGSGQKFEMLGMDNYFGAPFYIINNGAASWNNFNRLLKSNAYKTDTLSFQWFCLAHKICPDLLDEFRRQIFENARHILDNVPKSLQPGHTHKAVRINTVSDRNMEVSFIDIKTTGPFQKLIALDIERRFFKFCVENKIATHSKPSLGFYYPNYCYIGYSNEAMSIRINPGLDPKANQKIIQFVKSLA